MIRKTLVLALISMFYTSFAIAEVGINIGVSAQLGEMSAKGSESNSDTQTNAADGVGTQSRTEEAIFGSAGFFIEKTLGSRFALGYSNIMHDIGLGTADNATAASLGAAGATVAATTHELKADITGFNTFYATVRLTDFLYVKAGSVNVDLDTRFTKAGVVSSDYGSGSHSLDGTVFGLGLENKSDNGLFFRLEVNSYDIDGKSVASSGTDSTLTAKLEDVSGETARISIGKSF